jgi:hypothetical protein
MRNKIIKSMFEDNSEEFAGYWNIVNKLVEDKVCISTVSATDIDFGSLVMDYIEIEPYEKGVGLVKIILDKDKLVESEEFEEIRQSWVEDELLKIEKLKKEVDNCESKIILLNRCGRKW